jgi:integrase
LPECPRPEKEPALMAMPRLDITDAAVRSALAAGGPPRTYLDNALPGFMLVVNAQSASFVYQRKVSGRSVRVKLGRVGEIKADKARDAAMAVHADMRTGVNPNEKRKQERIAGMTLGEAFALFMASEARSAKTTLEYNAWFKHHLERWEGRIMAEIGGDRAGVRKLHETVTAAARAEVVRRLAKVEKEVPAHAGHAMANNVLRLLSSIYSRARLEVPSLPENPTVNVSWHKKRKRKASLASGDEAATGTARMTLADWYKRIQGLKNPVKQDYWLCVIITGGRRNQMAEARWEHVDLIKGTWHFPKPKYGEERAYTIPLSKYLIEILQRRHEYNEEHFPGSPWVFPSHLSKAGHLTQPRNDRQGLPGAHALRHTYRTHSFIAGVTELESHLLMNHALENVNAEYVTREVTMEHLRVAQEKVTAYFRRHFEGDAPKGGKVVQMPLAVGKAKG